MKTIRDCVEVDSTGVDTATKDVLVDVACIGFRGIFVKVEDNPAIEHRFFGEVLLKVIQLYSSKIDDLRVSAIYRADLSDLGKFTNFQRVTRLLCGARIDTESFV